ncbi:hypothetical protein [Halopseudomonas oceani]|uniref:hypothetical protein n=1 Tax=Halopseudomonas oceani TaxID=1708783 RepID=UPI002AA865C5|nr:hypothetical protein [Halopseudomonas oceani]
MTNQDVVYFSKMFQAVPALAQVERVLPGTFVSNRRSTLRAAKRIYPDLETARYSKYLGRFSRGNRMLQDAGVIVTGSPYKGFLAPYAAKKCTVFHGTYTLLSREALERNSHFDLLCIIGPRMRSMIERYAGDIDLNTVETGFLPFCEFPDRTESFRLEMLGRLGLNKQYKTLLYTPSRRGYGSWDSVAEQILMTAPREMNLILRPHPSQGLTPRRADKQSIQRLSSIARKRGNALIDLSDWPLSSYLAIADVLVSDANSPAEESMFYDIPLIFTETEALGRKAVVENGRKAKLDQDHIDMRLSLFESGVCVDAASALDFTSLVSDALTSCDVFAKKRDNYAKWVFGHRDRLANVRVVEAIKSSFFN